jgi:4-azaleucine resistance transporter AzlC
LSGVKSELPIAIGVIPFGLIYGVLALGAGLPPAPAMAMSSVVFAGSAQFIGQGLIGQGYPALVIILTTFVVNLRHLLYSASVAPFVQPLPARWKWGLAYLLTDEAYATTIVNYQQPGEVTHKHWFFLGAGLTLWSVWQTSTALGIFLGAQVPASWGLEFTLALTFIGLVIPAFRNRADVSAALSAGIVALLAADLPWKLGLMLAALIGIAVGVIVESGTQRERAAVAATDDG